MLRYDLPTARADDELAATVFHELAHQQLYVKGDTEFNESFATFVQREGLRQWRAARGLAPTDVVAQTRSDEFDALVLAVRERLQNLYASDLAPNAMRAGKRAEIDRLRSEYFRLRDTQWHADPSYDDWIKSEINDAKLLSFGLYHRWVAAFAALYTKQHDDWPAFYAAVAKMARANAAERLQMLMRLQEAAP